MADTQTLDIFDGLPLDYNFLESGDASADGTMNLVNRAPAHVGGFVGPDDQMLLDSDVPGSSHTYTTTPKIEGEDLLTPLSFSFNSNVTTSLGPNYRVAPQHKHKRVRSNPDVLLGFGLANMAPSVITPPILGPNGGAVYPQQHSVIMPMGSFQVEPSINPIPFRDTGIPQGESFQEMDEFLQDLSWSELSTDQQQQRQQQHMSIVNAATMGENSVLNEGASPVSYRSHRIQEGVNELKIKRKRPVNHHSRHHSNPVDLLHNLDQFRILAEQNKQQKHVQQQQLQQQQNMNSNQGYPNPFASFQDHTVFPPPAQPNVQQFQFQVPPQIASGAVHSLHGRRSSLGSSLPPRAAARRRGGPHHSSGLSMDMAQMNLGFLSVPEEPSMAEFNSHQSPHLCSVNISASSSGSKMTADEANRKLYKCGRCGQPKVGHICTMPDQRNNWTQVDLGVTKGLKVMRINCHIMPVKSKWVAKCDDHEPVQVKLKSDIKREKKVEAVPLEI